MSRHAKPDGSPGAPDLPWFRTLTAKLVGGAGAVLVGVLTAVIATSVDHRVNPPPSTPSLSASVTNGNATTTLPGATTSTATTSPSSSTSQPAYAGPRGSGWSVDGKASQMSGDLLTLTASMDPGDACHGAEGWLFDQAPAGLAPLPFSADPNAWAVRNGGTPASGNFVTVDVQARPGHPVIVDSIGYRVVARASVTPRSWPHLSGGCGGLTPSFFAADVDRGTPLRAVAGQDANGAVVKPVPLPHRLDDADPSEQWRIALRTTTCRCDVVPFFTYSSGGLSATVEITNRGGAWRVEPARGASLLTRESEAGSWTAYGTAS